MPESKRIPFAEKLRQGRLSRLVDDRMVLAVWACACAGSLLFGGCSTAVTYDGPRPFARTAATLNEAIQPSNETTALEQARRRAAVQPSNYDPSNSRDSFRDVGEFQQLTNAQTNPNPPAEVAQASFQEPASTIQTPTAQSGTTIQSSPNQQPGSEYVLGNPNNPVQGARQAPAQMQKTNVASPEKNRVTSQQRTNTIPNDWVQQPTQPDNRMTQPMTDRLPTGQQRQTSVLDSARPTSVGYQSIGYPGTEVRHSAMARFADSPPGASIGYQSYDQPASTGHLVDGMNMYGSELRQRTVTATELALRLTGENEMLKREIQVLRARTAQLSLNVDDLQRQLNQSREETLQAKQENADIRQSVAKLNLKVEDLENEKKAIELNADKTLREIESTLDHLLLDSVSKSGNAQPAVRSPK